MASFSAIYQKWGGVGIHCAGALWKEEGQFQQWYERLIGARMVDHPPMQKAKLNVESTYHPIAEHLDSVWVITDEWHRLTITPGKGNVLVSLDEESYEGEEKRGEDYPFTWYQYFDGGRSFFTSLGHTPEIDALDDYQKLLRKGILWASGSFNDY